MRKLGNIREFLGGEEDNVIRCGVTCESSPDNSSKLNKYVCWFMTTEGPKTTRPKEVQRGCRFATNQRLHFEVFLRAAF